MYFLKYLRRVWLFLLLELIFLAYRVIIATNLSWKKNLLVGYFVVEKSGQWTPLMKFVHVVKIIFQKNGDEHDTYILSMIIPFTLVVFMNVFKIEICKKKFRNSALLAIKILLNLENIQF